MILRLSLIGNGTILTEGISNMTTRSTLPRWFKRLWISALKSGHYKQGTRFLYRHKNKNYCCLGVALDLMCPFTPERYHPGKQEAMEMIDLKFASKFGLSRTHQRELAFLNDYKCNGNFNPVIAYIQKNL